MISISLVVEIFEHSENFAGAEKLARIGAPPPASRLSKPIVYTIEATPVHLSILSAQTPPTGGVWSRSGIAQIAHPKCCQSPPAATGRDRSLSETSKSESVKFRRTDRQLWPPGTCRSATRPANSGRSR